MNSNSNYVSTKLFVTLVILFISFLLSSCRDHPEYEKTTIGSEVKTAASPLQLEKMDLGDKLFAAERCYVFSDSILVIQNLKNSMKPFLEFYNLFTGELYKTAILRGNGPNELLDMISKNSNNYLLINGYVNDKYSRINVSDFVNSDNNVISFTPYSFECQSMDQWNNDLFIVENPYRFVNKQLRIKQNVPRLLFVGANSTIENNDLISAINVTRGNMLINKSIGKICYYSRSDATIELYDTLLNLKKAIIGPDQLKQEYSMSNGSLVFSNVITNSYLSACYNDSILLFAYEGREKNPMNNNAGDDNHYNIWLFMFDWDGNFVKSFVFDGKRVVCMSLTSTHTLYITCKESGSLNVYCANIE